MGNTFLKSKRNTTKVMKISGETMKLKTPLKAEEVTKDYPGFVLLESEDVKHYGTRAKPLQPHQNLEPKRVYFLVELPQNVSEGSSRVRVRKVRSGIQMSAKDRLESLMLSRRSVSDIGGGDHGIGRMRRVRMVVPKVEMDRLMSEAKSEEEIADKIVQLCLNKNNNGGGGNNGKIGLRERRVSFQPINEVGGSQIAIAAS